MVFRNKALSRRGNCLEKRAVFVIKEDGFGSHPSISSVTFWTQVSSSGTISKRISLKLVLLHLCDTFQLYILVVPKFGKPDSNVVS